MCINIQLIGLFRIALSIWYSLFRQLCIPFKAIPWQKPLSRYVARSGMGKWIMLYIGKGKLRCLILLYVIVKINGIRFHTHTYVPPLTLWTARTTLTSRHACRSCDVTLYAWTAAVKIILTLYVPIYLIFTYTCYFQLIKEESSVVTWDLLAHAFVLIMEWLTQPQLYGSNFNSMVWVRERTIPTERPPLVGEVIANFADRGCYVVSVTDPYGRILGFLDRSRYFSIK
jgi:hypothetical protein